jgi:hypothetical protein
MKTQRARAVLGADDMRAEGEVHATPGAPVAAVAAGTILLRMGLLLGALGSAACKAPPPAPPPFKPIATTAELMHAVVDPSADVLWASVGSVSTLEGVEDFFPRTEDEWIRIENAATVLMESGNLLMIGERAQDQTEWMTRSQDLVDAGKLALTAAQSRNPDEIFKVGGEVYAACDACHQLYWVEGADPDGVKPDAAKPASQ